MARASTGIYAPPTPNSFNPAVAGTAINQTDWNALLTDITAMFNTDIYCCLSADYTLTDQNTVQKAFNASSTGTFAVAASTTYLVQGQYFISNTGTNSHTWAVAFALSTASFSSANLHVIGRTGTTSAITFAADLSAFTTDPTTPLVCTAASTSSTEFVDMTFRGIFRVNAAGTITPQVKQSATTGGTLKMLANSWIRLTPIGGNSVAAIGTWT